MLVEDRLQRIRRIVEYQNSATVTQLCAELSVSDATIRKDLNTLEEKGYLKRTHGGAVKVDVGGTSFEPKIGELASSNVDKKRKIAAKAYQMIKDGEALILDSSSTAGLICEFICLGDKRGLTVVTNSAKILMELIDCKNADIIMIGGQVRSNIVSCVGSLATEMLQRVRVDRAFIGANGIDLYEDVITTPNLYEAEMKSAMMSVARQTTIVVDSTKFGKPFLGVACRASEVDYILTDDGISQDVVDYAAANNVNLVVCDGSNRED